MVSGAWLSMRVNCRTLNVAWVWGPNFKARTIFFDFQNAPDGRTPRGSPSRETIRSPSIVCWYIRAYIPTYTIEREPIFTKPLLIINSLILVKIKHFSFVKVFRSRNWNFTKFYLRFRPILISFPNQSYHQVEAGTKNGPNCNLFRLTLIREFKSHKWKLTNFTNNFIEIEFRFENKWIVKREGNLIRNRCQRSKNIPSWHFYDNQ